MTAEIKTVARAHLATDGANLSLRAVARDMGMVSSAIYRYFASRDELLTALILDAYNALGEAVEAADAAVSDRHQLRARWLAATRAVRGWALANPAEYALVYGSPVPATPRRRTPSPRPRGRLSCWRGSWPTASQSGQLARAGHRPSVPIASVRARRPGPGARRRRRQTYPRSCCLPGCLAWIQMFGVVSFELFGQFNNVIDARAEFFDQQMELMADLMGL